jgi:serine/threonine protein kinase
MVMPKIRNYNILECIGYGGFGQVYRAVKRGGTEEVALKVILNGEYLIIQEIFIEFYFYLT